MQNSIINFHLFIYLNININNNTHMMMTRQDKTTNIIIISLIFTYICVLRKTSANLNRFLFFSLKYSDENIYVLFIKQKAKKKKSATFIYYMYIIAIVFV